MYFFFFFKLNVEKCSSKNFPWDTSPVITEKTVLWSQSLQKCFVRLRPQIHVALECLKYGCSEWRWDATTGFSQLSKKKKKKRIKCLMSSILTRRRQWHPTTVLLPGKSHGRRSLVGYSSWGHKELDMIEHTHTHSQQRP